VTISSIVQSALAVDLFATGPSRVQL